MELIAKMKNVNLSCMRRPGWICGKELDGSESSSWSPPVASVPDGLGWLVFSLWVKKLSWVNIAKFALSAAKAI